MTVPVIMIGTGQPAVDPSRITLGYRDEWKIHIKFHLNSIGIVVALGSCSQRTHLRYLAVAIRPNRI